MRLKALPVALILGIGITACGDAADAPPPADQPAPEQPAAEMTMPDWFQVDHDAETVEIDLVAGATSANNYWNFQGYHGGAGSVTVPAGYTVTINLINEDPNMGHSVGVGEMRASWPSNFSEVTPVFEGAVTSNPTSMTESTMPGETETITFVADAAGEYALICYVVGHAAAGMWMPFNVSAEGEAGVTG
jgi:sulfocyanin